MAHAFCQVSLRIAKKMAQDAGVSVPTLTAPFCDKSGTNRQYEIHANGEYIGWFKGDCASDAKSQYITRLIDKADEAAAL
jgi:hypothetical protein